jgi:DNA-binding MarR family transcriptional regulator
MMKPDQSLESRAAEVAQFCTSANLRRAARGVTRVFDAAMQPCGIKGTPFTLLVAVGMVGRARLTPLAERLGMDRTTLTRNLKPLVDKGFVRIAPGEDRRSRVVTLTPGGRAALEQALPLWEQAQAKIVAGLGKQRWRGLMADLAALTHTKFQA